MLKSKYSTKRLLLQSLTSFYANEVLDYYIRNKDFLKEWDPVRETYFYTPWYQRRLLRDEVVEFKQRTSVKFWIIHKGKDKIIGNVCFSNIVMGNFRSAYLSYKLDKDEINHGYITEAIQEAINIGFKEIGLHRIEVNVIPRNIRSLRVIEKLGFKEEGYSPKYLKINGVWEGHKHFAIYNDDEDL